MHLGNIIKRIISEEGFQYKERQRTIHTICPRCGLEDKLSILKSNGATICYRGRCQFKGFFGDWLAETANISRKDAQARIYSKSSQSRMIGELKISLKDPYAEGKVEQKSKIDLSIVPWPIPGSFDIDAKEAQEGTDYLISRGIPIDIAKYYNIRYSPVMRRILFPVLVGDTCYGWQGRSIDIVDKSMKMRNNTGFNRASLIMFADQLQNKDYAIICEGPVDAIKFHRLGGNVATLGKVITNQQMELLQKYNIKKFFLALDDDGIPEMREIANKANIATYRLKVPLSCIKRCEKDNKKADFGECTFDECIEAAKSAELITQETLMTYFDKPYEIYGKRLKGANNAKKS